MRAASVDRNQPEIVAALRAIGARVQHLHGVGSGCPDLLVGFAGEWILIEVKDGLKQPSQRKLTPDQVVWHEKFKGLPVFVCESPEAAVLALTKGKP